MNARIAALCFSLALAPAACGTGSTDVWSTNGTSSRTEALFGQQSLTYSGGPLLAHPKIRIVYWGSGVSSATQATIGNYYTAVMASQWLAWLNDEYAINGQTIGAGQVVGSTTIAPWNTPSDVYAIGQELDRQMTGGYLAAPDADTIYMVHLPAQYAAQWTYSDGTHGDAWSFVRLGMPVRYGVIPDFANAATVQIAASATLAGLYTDPDHGRLDSWANNYHESQASMCNEAGGTVWTPAGPLTVASLWSNANQACLTTPLENQIQNLTLTNSTSLSAPGQTNLVNNTASTLHPVVASAPAGITVDFGGDLAPHAACTLRITAASNVHAASGTVVVRGLDQTSGVVRAIARFNVSVGGLYLSPQVSSAPRGGVASTSLENNTSANLGLGWGTPIGFTYLNPPPSLLPNTTNPVSIQVPATVTPGLYSFYIVGSAYNAPSSMVPGWINVTCGTSETYCPGDNTCLPPGSTCPPMCNDGICDSTETCSSCAIDCGACPPPVCPAGKVDCCGDGTCVSRAMCKKITCN